MEQLRRETEHGVYFPVTEFYRMFFMEALLRKVTMSSIRLKLYRCFEHLKPNNPLLITWIRYEVYELH
jgi:hypothetical protein